MKVFILNSVTSFAILFLYLMLNINEAVGKDYLSLLIIWLINIAFYLFLCLILYAKILQTGDETPFSLCLLRVASFLASIILIVRSFYEAYLLVILIFIISIFSSTFHFYSKKK